MTAAPATSLRRYVPEALRWGACFVAVVAVHVGTAAALLTRWEQNDLLANPPAIVIDLAPMAVSPEIAPPDMPVGPQQVESEPEPQPEKVEPPPPQSTVQMEPPPKPPEPPKEKEKPKKERQAKATTAPAPARQHADVAASPNSGANGSAAIDSWKSQLVSRLERGKRYPSEARSRGEQGVVYLSFVVDRGGGVHGARISRSSGSSALDNETLALASRVSPLPPPPAEMPGGSIPISVPIRYNIR
jgi:protein TonB